MQTAISTGMIMDIFWKQGEINQDKVSSFKHHFSPCLSMTQWESFSSSLTLTFLMRIENLLLFLKYFDDKISFMMNFPLGFNPSFVFCAVAERFESEKIVQIFSAILNLVR